MCRFVQPRQAEDNLVPELFEKTWIKSIELSNRAIRSATWSGVGDERGYVTEKAVEFYRELARGDIGLIVTGYQYVLPNGRQLLYAIGNYEDGQIEGLSRLADAVHAEGGAIVPQIVHCGVRANKNLFVEDGEIWGPSAIPDPVIGIVPKEVNRSEITQLIDAYAAAAERALRSRFDGVQLHGAHGYGINQFLSPLWNQRGDAYGGNLKKRYRFLGEVLEAVRGAVGDDFPVLIKLTGADFAEGGLVPEDCREIARRLADDGIDGIEVSGGSPASPKNMGPLRMKIRSEADEAYFAGLAAAIRESVNVPVITVGGIRTVKTIERILGERKADYVAMSRPFVREPHLLNRWKSGDLEGAACISCGRCFETGMKGIGISCKVAREQEEEASS
jgi:2,4-dienoyl-CoA reductase-like NADH-dependent reductase (Old Yellow Enzyme family)